MTKGIRKISERIVKNQRRIPRIPEMNNIQKEIFAAFFAPNEVA
jgi:hypothetical protein